MTLWNPEYRVKVNGSTVTSVTLAGMTITSGRTDIYAQPQPGYANISLLETNEANAYVGALGGLSSSISGISSSVTGGSRGGGTGGTSAQRRALSEIESNFAQLQALVAGLTGGGIPAVAGTYGAFQPMDASRVTYGGGAPIVTVNVNAPSVIDEVGFTRAVVDAMNSVERTSAGGYSALFK